MKFVFQVGKNLFSFRKTNFKRGLGEIKVSMTSRSDDQCDYVEHYECIKRVEEFIPKLKMNLHKGECGRIGIIGGSAEYTGAPFFAAMSALRTGADLVFVMCCREAAPVIKSYSPELIVLPVLDARDIIKKADPWLNKLHVVVIGPGLGRDTSVLRNVGLIMTHCKDKLKFSPPLVIDADGLYLVSANPDLIKDYKAPIIYTPNFYEYTKLAETFSGKDTMEVASRLNGVIVLKGQNDIITNGIYQKELNFTRHDVTLVCEIPGSNRRCGGQGDLLAGSIATFVGWYRAHVINQELKTKKESEFRGSLMSFDFNEEEPLKVKKFQEKFMGYSFAAYGACAVIRSCGRFAFDERGRGMTASDMIPFIHKAFKVHFGV